MMNENMWLMDEHGINELSFQYRNFLMHGQDQNVSDPVDAVIRHEGYNELKIQGPMIANESMFTRWLGINTTEQHMKAF